MLFDVIALILGVFFTIRKLDVRRRESPDFPGVDPTAFELWKSTALKSYNIGAICCFGRLALDYALRYGIARFIPWRAVQIAGFVFFVSWVGLLVFAWVLASRARGLQEKAGIRFDSAPVPR